MKFVSDLRQISSFLQVLQYSPPLRLTAIKPAVFEEEKT
jgi:hypothetical protein